jgi:hypothetical protein
MTTIRNRYTGKPIFDFDGDAKATIEAAVKARANLEGANLEGANLAGANLAGANLARANLEDANLEGANLEDTYLPIYCKWRVTYKLDGSISIGCKAKSIAQWDKWFAGTEEFETKRDSDEFKRIRANYLAVRAYCVAMGIGQTTGDRGE